MMEYLTAKEFAAAAGVSTQTIYKQMSGRLAPYVKTIKGKKRIAAAALKEYYDVEENFSETTDFQSETTENQSKKTDFQSETIKEQSKSTTENQSKSTEINHSDPNSSTTNQDQQIEALNKLIEIVQKELEEKDRQLAVKDKQIQDLSDRLAEALQLTKGQQYIAAADKTKELIEADGKRGQQEEPPIVVQEAAADQDDKQSVDTEPKKKSFWQRLFGR